MKSTLFKLVIAFSFISSLAGASVDPAELLLNSYRSQCPNVVSFTGNSQALLSAFKNILVELKNREQCYGVNGGMSGLTNFENAYTNYELYRTNKISKEEKEKLIADYTLFLSQSQMSLSSDQIAYIESQIFSNQTSIIALDSEVVRFEHMGQGFEQGASAFLSSFDDLLASLDGNQQCLDKSQSTYSSLLGNGLSIASLFSNPANSLYLSMAGSVVKSISGFVQDSKYTKLINEADSILWPEAIRCVSEAMTKNYCGAVQTQNLYKNYLYGQNGDRVIFDGVDLINYYLLGLDEWLVQVRAGSPSTSQGDLTDREKPIAQAELVGKISRFLQAYKRVKDEELNLLADQNSISNAIYGAMVGVSNIMNNPVNLTPRTDEGQCYSNCNPDVQNPIFIARTKTLLLFELIGYREIPRECLSSGEKVVCSSLISYMNNTGRKFSRNDWEMVYSSAMEIVSETIRLVNIQRARAVSFDPVGLFVQARRQFHNKPNAVEGLKEILKNGKRIQDYITEVACEEEPEFCDGDTPNWMNSYSLQIEDVEETLKLTRNVVQLIIEAANPRSILDVELPVACRRSEDTPLGITLDSDRKEKAFILSTCISNLLQLSERGNDIYFNKIRNMVSMELQIKISKGDFDDKTEDILRATRDDLIDRLTRTYSDNSNASIGQILTGLDSSKDITRKTMGMFFDVFKDRLEKIIAKGDNSPRVQSELCFRVLPFLDESKDSRKFIHKIYDECKGKTLQEYRDGPKLNWSDFVEKKRKGLRVYPYKVRKSQEEMTCALDYFFIQNRLIREKRNNSRRR